MKTHNSKVWQWILVAVLAAMLLLVVGGSALASDIRNGDSITIGTGEVIDDDLILFGNTIVVNGTVNGDLIAFGNSVTLNGIVNGSALLGGETLNVTGQVKGSLYGGGAAMYLRPTAVVERNMMFGGYQFQTDPGSLIVRDLSMGGAQAILSGKVGRDLKFGGQALELNGQIGRNVSADVAEPNQSLMPMSYGPNLPPAIASGLRVGRDAKIGGQLSYVSTVDQGNEILATPGGGVVFKAQPITEQVQPSNFTYEWLFNRVRDFITVLLIGLVALWLIRPWVTTAVMHAQTKPLGAAGWGFLMLIAGYALAFVLFVAIVLVGILLGMTTLGGLSLATFGIGFAGATLFVTVFTAVVVWGTKVIVSMLIGKLILERFAKEYADNVIATFVLGLLLFEIVAAIPWLGVVATFVAILLGLGAIWYVYYEGRKTHALPTSKPAPMPA